MVSCDASSDSHLTSVSTPSEFPAASSPQSPAAEQTSSRTDQCSQPSIESYEILDELGSGGMGTVFKTRRDGVDKTLAIKKLHARFAADEASKRRFQQEAKAASLLTHANLVSVYDYGMSSQGEPYLVMDCIDGKSLGEVIKETNGLTVRRFISIFMQVCDAMSHAHAKQVIHRDLKPNNILLTKSDEEIDVVKIVDFGIAKLMPEAETTEQKVTQTGDVIGSPVYMSPEQCVGSNVDGRSDIYSIGCVMYEALMGEPPFLGENVVQTILQHLNDLPIPFGIKRPDLDIPEAIEAIVFRCLEKTPSARYQSFDELKDALELVADTTSDARKKIIEKRIAQAKIARWLKVNGTKTQVLLMIAALVTGISAVCYFKSVDETALQNALEAAQKAYLVDDRQEAHNKLTFAANQAVKLNKPNKFIGEIYIKLTQIDRFSNWRANFDERFFHLQQARKYLRNSTSLMDRMWVLQNIQDAITSTALSGPDELSNSYLKQLRHEASALQKEHQYKEAFEKLLTVHRSNYNLPKVLQQMAQICKDAAREQPNLNTLRMVESFNALDRFPSDHAGVLSEIYNNLVDRIVGPHDSTEIHLRLAAQAFTDADYDVASYETTTAELIKCNHLHQNPTETPATPNALGQYSMAILDREQPELRRIDTESLNALADLLKEKTDFEQSVGKTATEFDEHAGGIMHPAGGYVGSNYSLEFDLKQLANIQLLLGQYDAAKSTFERLLSVPEGKIDALSGLALVLGHQNKWPAAELTILPLLHDQSKDRTPNLNELRRWFEYCKTTGHESVARQERALLAARTKDVYHPAQTYFEAGDPQASPDDSPDEDQ